MAKEDLRVIRTRKLLSNALKELLQEKSFDKITVNDICERALVHRATFYNHFTDKTDLLNYIFDAMQDDIYQAAIKMEGSLSTKQMYVEIIDKIIDYVLANRQSIKLILKNSSQEFQKILSETMKRGIDYLVSKSKEWGQNCPNVNAIVSFFAGGLSAMCIEIVLSDNKFDKKEMMEYLENVLEVTLNAKI